MPSKPCRICGDTEPFHVHDNGRRIENYFTVGRGMSEMDAAREWKKRAGRNEETVSEARQHGAASEREKWQALLEAEIGLMVSQSRVGDAGGQVMNQQLEAAARAEVYFDLAKRLRDIVEQAAETEVGPNEENEAVGKSDSGGDDNECPTCQGRGTSFGPPGMHMRAFCPACGGSGIANTG